MIGLSFSDCIPDILQGQVSIEQVDKLIVGCSWRNQAELVELIEYYRSKSWSRLRDFSTEEILAIVKQLESKIEIPKLWNPPRLPANYHGYWANSEDEVVLMDVANPEKRIFYRDA